MVNRLKGIMSFSKKAFILIGFLGISSLGASITEAQNLNLWGRNTDNKIQPNCYLRKEYNYFMSQWTTNEICNPKIYEVPEREINISNRGSDTGSNVFMGASPFTYSQPQYRPQVQYKAPAVANTYRGYYANNPTIYTSNNWNGYGSAANYLLGSFGGGTYGGSYGSSYYYPTAVSYYTPSNTGLYGYTDYGYGYIDNGYWDWDLGYDYLTSSDIADNVVLNNPDLTEPDYYQMAQEYGQANGLSYDEVDSLYNYGYDSYEE